MSELEVKILSKADVDYLAAEATEASAADVDAVRDLVRQEAGVDPEATHVKVFNESGEAQTVRVNSIGSVSMKNAVAVHSGNWQNPENK